MRKRCRNCLCWTCLYSCMCRKCRGRIKECNQYSGCCQLSIFETKPQMQTVTPRYSWQYYGITKERYRQLTEYIQSGRYDSLALQAAHEANEMIAEYILLSVTQNKSYDALRMKWELKEMERIPYCRTDFYGIRRYFFSIFNEKMKEIGK